MHKKKQNPQAIILSHFAQAIYSHCTQANRYNMYDGMCGSDATLQHASILHSCTHAGTRHYNYRISAEHLRHDVQLFLQTHRVILKKTYTVSPSLSPSLTHTNTCTHTCMHVCTHTHPHTHTNTHTHTQSSTKKNRRQ